ncbi:glycosyltransferase WbuB [Flaviflexus salsibiostraticola]|uniref:Glycosyltransferase WbuB n=1 Tax=Flaviflexus salsibiostraticola TaxID=1282737 RepID=A0A3Q8WV60_9ACTO|nr:glycosyltransferase WbuB [Flaviflexus salsibiostraticola]
MSHRSRGGDRAPRVTISSRIWEPERAAAAFRLRSLAAALVESGARVRVHTSKPPRQLTEEAASADQQAPFSVDRHRVLRGKDGYLRGYLQYLSFDLPLLWHLLTDAKPDVYVCEPPPTTGLITRTVAAIRRRPYVYYAADIWSDASESANVPSFVVSALRAVERWVLTGAADVIAVNAAVAERARQLGATNVTTVQNGVDTTIFTPDGDRSPLAGTQYFVYAGTMSEWQGSDIFVRALAQIHADFPDLKLVFVGQGNAVAELRQVAEDLGVGDAVQILPAVSPEVAAAFQRDAIAALVSIRPGIGYDMAFPTKTMAAWACGTPVIYAGAGIARELIEANDLGWSCAYDVAGVAQAMRSSAASISDHRPIARWALDNVSLGAAAKNAATAILRTVKGPR